LAEMLIISLIVPQALLIPPHKLPKTGNPFEISACAVLYLLTHLFT
jgi:hypothetical protein